MDGTQTEDLVELNRRNYLAALSGLGISGAALNYLSKDVLAETTENPEKEVPVLTKWRHSSHDEFVAGEKRERKPVYETIPRRDWYIIKSAYNAAENFRNSETVSEFGSNIKIGVRNDGTQGKSIVADYTILLDPEGNIISKPEIKFREFEQEIPAHVQGVAGEEADVETYKADIPIVPNKIYKKQQYFNCDYRPVPGGCAISTSAGAGATLGTPAYDADVNKDVLVTAGHVVDESGLQEVYQDYGEDDKVGTENNSQYIVNGDFDAVTLDLSDGINVNYRLATDTCDEFKYDIYGAVTHDGLINMQHFEETIYMQGRSAGVGEDNPGIIDTIYETDFRDSCDSQSGDSGGPHYDVDNGNEAYIAGIHGGSASGYAYATKQRSIEEEWGLYT